MAEVLEKGLQRQAFVAARSDPGTGTATDPYNVTGPDKFAEVMQAIPEYSEVNVLPGVYETYGYSFAIPERSFKVKTGWKLRGCGRESTVLKLVDVQNTPDQRYFLLRNHWEDFASFSEVSDVTLDMNFGAQPYDGGMMSACHLNGSHVRIKRVRVSNFGNKGQAHENFLLGVAGGFAGRPVCDSIIEDCIIEDPFWIAGDSAGCLPIQLFGSDQPTYKAVVRNCYINGQYPDRTISAYNPIGGPMKFKPGRAGMGAIGSGNGYQFVYRDNTVLNCLNGVYLDTGAGKDYIVRGNTFFNVLCGVGLHYPNADCTWDRVVIEDNDIALVKVGKAEPPGTEPSGIYLGAHTPGNGPSRVQEAIIRNNRIQLVDRDMDPLNRAFAAISLDYVKQAVIEDNTIRLPPSTTAHICVSNVPSVRSRNNLQPETNSIIAPWRTDLKRFVPDEFETLKAEVTMLKAAMALVAKVRV